MRRFVVGIQAADFIESARRQKSPKPALRASNNLPVEFVRPMVGNLRLLVLTAGESGCGIGDTQVGDGSNLVT